MCVQQRLLEVGTLLANLLAATKVHFNVVLVWPRSKGKLIAQL